MLGKTGHRDGSAGFRRGQPVTVRSLGEILATLDADAKVDGLPFMPEMVPYCGQSFRVLSRVEKIVNEKTGQMMNLPNPCIILEGVTCSGNYSSQRMFSRRHEYPYWRELWLERIPQPAPTTAGRG